MSAVAFASRDAVWLVTASPINGLLPSGTVSEPTTVQLLPSADVEAVMMLPARASFTQRGGAPATAVLVVCAPALARRWNVIPLDGVTNSAALAESAAPSLRIITPALVQAFTFSTVATRATIAPSPDIG